jgi:hypothetical protein
MLLQAMLGLQQDAPRGKLYVDPVLPDWLPDVTLIDLRLGRRRFDIRFWRDSDKTRWKVLKGNHDAVTERSYASRSYYSRADQDASGCIARDPELRRRGNAK